MDTLYPSCQRTDQLPRWALFLVGLLLVAAEPTAEQAEFFEKKVRPLLAENCYQCHSEAKKKTKGNLTLDTLDGMLRGGDTGPALVPGQPDKSLLIKAVRHTDPELKMPPKNKLGDDQITVLADWIKMGAPWPGAKSTSTVRSPGKITDEDRKWWSFQPLRSAKVPDVANAGWVKNPIDRFILQRLEQEGLQPSAPASRAALVRRVYFDLTGLPPTPKELDEALGDMSANAYEKLIDRLLASPRYGERWARHWLDLVRYAESDGFRIDDYRPDAWRYRDYVIRAFNSDKPYDRFVREQLAGDELAPDDPDALTATGYLRHWIYEYNQRDVRTQWTNILNDLTDVTGDVFLGLGMGCARCHDHKFDPILQKDYYRLQAFFAGFMPRDDVPLATPQQLLDYRAKLAQWEAKTAEIRQEIEAIEAPARAKAAKDAIAKFPEEIQTMILKPVGERSPLEHQLAEMAYRQILYEYARLEGKLKDEQKQQLIALRKKLAGFAAQKPAPLPAGATVSDAGSTAPPTSIPKKASAPPVEPGYLTLLDEKPAVIEPRQNSTGRRTELARWLTQPDNPLTTRVIVNRVWQYHFGQGLAISASDFGRLGEKPSHPELLDWLAARFVQDGWSFKQLHRLIFTSATYRQSATEPADELALKKDPENRLLWRMTTRRLDAEQIRDAMLAVTGELDIAMGGPSVDASKPRRSVYCRVVRNTRDPLLDVFDLPEGFNSTAQRNVTTTPTQSLLMFNGPYMLTRAGALAERLGGAKASAPEATVDEAFRLAFGRLPTSAERSRAVAFLRQQAEKAQGKETVAAAFQSEKMPYREGRAAVMQPDGPQPRFLVPNSETMPAGDFTVEGFILLRTLYEDASVRTIASHYSGTKNKSGWSFGVTGKKSQFKPQTLVLQLFGDPSKNGADTENIFSGLHITLNKPYFVAVTVHVSETGKEGVTFYAKDLSNDDEPLQVAHNPHKISSMDRPPAAFTIGGRERDPNHSWDGLIDDVRLSSSVLRQEQLLLTAEGVTDKTVGYWQFEAKPGHFKDSSPHGNHIQVKTTANGKADPKTSALIDLCHVLLNANEFLYVD